VAEPSRPALAGRGPAMPQMYCLLSLKNGGSLRSEDAGPSPCIGDVAVILRTTGASTLMNRCRRLGPADLVVMASAARAAGATPT
jgi:hypothetical protein